jgi:hypothetical protein
MRPTELTLDVLESRGQHETISIRVQMRVQVLARAYARFDLLVRRRRPSAVIISVDTRLSQARP